MEYIRPMNNEYKLIFYIVGISDYIVNKLSDKQIDIYKKGDIYSKKSGKKFSENIAEKIIFTTYEEGFPPIIEELISFIKNNSFMDEAMINSKRISLQICIYTYGESAIPYIHFTPEQLYFLSKIKCALDFHML